jgi:predicted Zn-dependent protease
LNYKLNRLLALIIKALLAILLIVAQWSVLLLPAHAQSVLPTLGDGSDTSSAEERALGDTIARELYRDPDYTDDPILAEYTLRVWQRLLDAARAKGELTPEMDQRFAWKVLLGRDRTVNAFALPGGYLGVNAGLLAITDSQDEFASVLAHELSHVTQRHISRLITQDKRQLPLMVATMLLGALAISKSPELANAVVVGGSALTAQHQLNFSRDMEREADRIGYGVLVKAGYDGAAFAAMFEKLQQSSRLNDNGSFPYLRSHPLTTERIADMRSRVMMDEQGAAPPQKGSSPRESAARDDATDASGTLDAITVRARADVSLEHTLIATRARVVSRGGVDDLRAWATAPDEAGFRLEPRAQQASGLYAAAMSRMRERDFAGARALAARLPALIGPMNDAGAMRLALLLQVEVEIAAGDGAAAARLLAGSQQAGARPERIYAAEAALAGGGSLADAIDGLQTWVATHPRDGAAWQWLGQLYSADGQKMRALRAQGEQQMAQLDWAGAVDRFRAGQALLRSGGSREDYIEASIIDTRLADAQSRLADEKAAKR